MCEYETCPCRYHSTKILNDFFDIFESVFSVAEEAEIEDQVEKGTYPLND